MTVADTELLMAAGRRLGRTLGAPGIVALGEIGVGNTTVAAVLAAGHGCRRNNGWPEQLPVPTRAAQHLRRGGAQLEGSDRACRPVQLAGWSAIRSVLEEKATVMTSRVVGAILLTRRVERYLGLLGGR